MSLLTTPALIIEAGFEGTRILLSTSARQPRSLSLQASHSAQGLQDAEPGWHRDTPRDSMDFCLVANRLVLPAWLGAGSALEKAASSGNISMLKEMRHEWPFFASRLSMLGHGLRQVK